jgi:hypothetical protein
MDLNQLLATLCLTNPYLLLGLILLPPEKYARAVAGDQSAVRSKTIRVAVGTPLELDLPWSSSNGQTVIANAKAQYREASALVCAFCLHSPRQ